MEAVLEKPKSKQKKKRPKVQGETSKQDDKEEIVDNEQGCAIAENNETELENHHENAVVDSMEKTDNLDVKNGEKSTVGQVEIPVAVEKPIEGQSSEMGSNRDSNIRENANTFDKYLLANKEIINSLKLSNIEVINTRNKASAPEELKETNKHYIKPYTESQLSSLYANNELEEVKQFTNQFIEAELRGSGIKRHPLHELLENYLQARQKMTGNLLESTQLRKEYKETQNQIWSFDSAVVHGRGECHDGTTVVATHTYNKATFHRSVFQTIERILNSLQKVVNETHTLYSFLAETLRLKVIFFSNSFRRLYCWFQILLYLETLSANCFQSFCLNPSTPVSLVSQNIPTTLMAPLAELRMCISVLFSFQRRVIRDVQFIKETREWLSRLVAIFVRVASWQDHVFILNHILRCPAGVGAWAAHFVQVPLEDRINESPFSSYQINHVVAIFSAILMPIQKREQFLEQMSQSRDNTDEVLWVIVDSEGEEDEDSSGTSLRENDLVQLLNQLPLNNLFKNMLLVQTRDGQDIYDISQITENHILRFFAFCTVLLKILENGLHTYDQQRYHQFSKRLCRFIRHVVQYATDQWEQFKNSQRSEDVAMLCRLQVEYDAFFLRATKYLYTSQRMGAWQFLAVVPYHVVSVQTLWKIFYLLHNEDAYIATILDPTDLTDFSSKIWCESLRTQFEDKLILLDDAEVYYLMNTFANMVLARDEVDIEFIKIGTMDLLQIGFISEITQENCSKSARILLTHITSKYPYILSEIVLAIKKQFSSIGNLSLYLFEELPLSIWKPTKSDMEVISNWLTHSPISSDESRLARMILSRLNWGLQDGVLFLNYKLHFKVALLLAQVVEQESGYLQWAWQTAFRLRLHFSDKCFTDLSKIPELDNLNTINKGVREQKPFFCFLALMMTSWGHLVPMICNKGLLLLENLQTYQKHDAVLFALNLIVPLFLNCQESIINCEKYQNILVSLLNVDRTYVNIAKSLVVSQNTIVERFGNMIESQIKNYKWYNLDSPRCLIRLWMNSLVSIPNWNKDLNVLQTLDVIIKSAFFHIDAIDAAVNILKNQLECATPQETNTSISSLFKWASQSTSPQGSLLTSSSLPSCVWLAYILIALEHEEREKQTGLWKEILMQLRGQKGKVNVDAAIKKAAGVIKVPSFTSSSLCIYRWAQQALDTSLSHPLLPLVWQKFFMLYLVRVPVFSAADKGCIGEKFFEGIVNLGFLKRLKRRLQETIDYYQKKTESCDNGQVVLKKQNFESCQKLFKAYSLWLEEPRLQENNLHLPSLPPQYEPRLLALIVQENTAPWLEYLDYEIINLEQQKSVESWMMSIYRKKTNVNQPLTNAGGNVESSDPVERILRRLQSYDAPKEAPALIKSAPVLPPLAIEDKSSIIKTVTNQFKILQTFAQNHSMRISEHKSLDSTYKDLVPQLYRAVFHKVKKKVLCKGVSNNVCSGPAVITLEMQETRINERIDHQIVSNRADYELSLSKSLQSPPHGLCVASVTVEHAIEILQIRVKSNPSVSEIGVDLFYFILSLLNDELNFCPPTRNCVMNCLDKLGHSFICGVEFETPRLLNKILEEPNLVPLLAPHFSPVNIGTTNFLQMYGTICSDIGQRFDIIFPLLSKFDIPQWLELKQPKISQRSQFIELVVKGLTTLNFTPATESMMLHEVFRKHLLCIFEHQFPEHYGDVLTALLKSSYGGSESGCVAISVWMDIFNSLSHPIKLKASGNIREPLRQYAQQQHLLSYQELLETTRLLATHFFKERLQYGLYGLYPKYRNYVDIFVLLMGMTGHALIISALNIHQGVLGDKLCEIIWPYLRDLYAPWILPYWMNNIKETMASWMQQLTDDRAVLLPWIPADGPFAHKLVFSMFECIQFIIHTLPGCNTVLSYVWQWYVTNFAHPTVKDYVLNVVHGSFLALPWHNFWPSVADVELMLKVVEQYLPECHVFLGYIFIEISWGNWMKHVLANASPQIILRVHQCLLHLLVKLSNEPNIRSNHSDKTKKLLAEAENFNWDIIEPSMYQHIMDWYVMSCDALVIFVTDPMDLDFRVLHFLKVVAHYHEPAQNDCFFKQHIYIRTYVKLLSVLASRHKPVAIAKSEQLQSVINSNLTHLENVVKAEESLCIVLEDIFGILNIDVISKSVTKCFEQWFAGKSADSVVLKAAFQTLPSSVTNTDILSLLLETAIHSYFINNGGTFNSLSPWKFLANILKPFGPRQIELEQTLVAKGKILTLHVLLLQKIAVCADSGNLLNIILKWLQEVKVDTSIEDKIPLLWSQFLSIALLHCDIDMQSAYILLYKFSQLLLQIATEKGISGWGKGLLGAIGIVKQESVSLKFRFLSRAMSGYILAQLPESKGQRQVVRIAANAPSIVGQPGGNTECVKVLLGLGMGQTQGEIKSCAELALKQIQDPNNSLHNSKSFLCLITNQLYLKPYLKDLEH
ncbi:hypothetical protein FQR65_LT04154 [Abscondita terminalis]|nr:hypothetical protein FQR65_LT04154 [Abscondita terminalis]